MKASLQFNKQTPEWTLEHGLQGYPMNSGPFATKSGAEIAAPLRGMGLEISQIGCWGFNVLSPNAEVQAKEADLLRRVIEQAPEAGCLDVIIGGGNYSTDGFQRGHRDNFGEKALDDAARGLEPFLKLAEEKGVRLTIEPFIQTVVNTAERFMALKKRTQSKALFVNLDLCNFVTFDDVWAPTEMVRRTCDLLRDQYYVAHVKDITVSKGVHIHMDEAPFGMGMMDWATALPYIKRDLPAEGYVILEHCKSAEEAEESLERLRAMAGQAGIEL